MIFTAVKLWRWPFLRRERLRLRNLKTISLGRGPKLIVFKFRKRKRSRRKNGHRQSFTAVKITGVKG